VGAAPMQNIGAYGVEAKDVIEFVEYVELSDGSTHILDNGSCAFGYRDSVFKRELKDKAFISSVVFRLYKTKQTTTWIAASSMTPRNDELQDENYSLKLEYKDIQQEIISRNLDINDISVQDVADIITKIRSRKLPDWTQIGTAGSFFKNPIVLIEEFTRLKMMDA